MQLIKDIILIWMLSDGIALVLSKSWRNSRIDFLKKL